MTHNNQKKIALINDFTGFGKCSIAVSLPIISALGVQCCAVPTSIFSNHTGYEEYFFDDYTEKMQKYIDNWKKLNLKFEGITTGFLGSEKQIEIVEGFIRDFKDSKTIIIVDPVMGDDGHAYATYTSKMCYEMKKLVSQADIVTPNLTEACILTDTKYTPDQLTMDDIRKIAYKISDMGPDKIVITGINQGIFVSNYIFEKGLTEKIQRNKKIGFERAGTGDVFSSIIAADAVNGVDLEKSVRKASQFIKKCIKRSMQLDIPKEDGICFEEYLNKLRKD